ncbi:MAG: RdgB/HAM1 family non-canonical purine NTP pyrophosphatase [Acidimicrobiia bacterium]|nr:RdgB/HAM1 family non-canonical purine NTP pyrophosphatase [Acidimicrobiia bacterium]
MGHTEGLPVVVCASANPGKLRELDDALSGVFRLLARPDDLADVVEDAPTLEGNARLKATAVGESTGHAALADDTGLEVVALDGAPGVRSARYGGEPSDSARNIARLLAALEERGAVGRNQRRARFRTVLVLFHPDGREVVAEGRVDGVIASSPRGSNGFGYDSVFEPDGGDGRTFAEMTLEEKQALSHRARAIESLLVCISG